MAGQYQISLRDHKFILFPSRVHLSIKLYLQVSSLSVRKIDNLNDRLNFKLETATLALLAVASRRQDAISLQSACYTLQGFSPCRIYDRKAQFKLYKTRERIHRGLADPRLLPIPRS